MNNGKRWTIWKWDDERSGVTGSTTTDRIPEGVSGVEAARATGVEVMEIAEHNADLESLAQELEGRAGKVEADFDAEETRGTTRGFMWRVEFETLRSAAQLVRAKIEEGAE